jgi:hypothetical protein
MSEFGPSPEFGEPPFPGRENVPEVDRTARERALEQAEFAPPEALPWHRDEPTGAVESADLVPDWPGDHAVEKAAEQAEAMQAARSDLARLAIKAAFEAKEPPASDERRIGAPIDISGKSGTHIDGGDDDAVARAREEGKERVELFSAFWDVSGDPEAQIDRWGPQGQNDRGWRSTCGLNAAAEAAREQGIGIDEREFVELAAESDLCENRLKDHPEDNGTTKLEDLQELLSYVDLDAEVRKGQSMSDILSALDRGDSVLLAVDGHRMVAAGRQHKSEVDHQQSEGLPDRNHIIHITGAITHPDDGRLLGFIYNDPTYRPGEPVKTARLRHAWEDGSGSMLLVRRP